MKYIGETGCQISTRIKQHQKSIVDEKWEASGIANHKKSCNGSIIWNDIKNINIENNRFKRKVHESLEIQKNDTFSNGMNLDIGSYVTSTFWRPLMKHIHHTL